MKEQATGGNPPDFDAKGAGALFEIKVLQKWNQKTKVPSALDLQEEGIMQKTPTRARVHAPRVCAV